LYDAQLTALLKEQLNEDHAVIEDKTRSQLLDDYFTFAWEGKKVSYAIIKALYLYY